MALIIALLFSMIGVVSDPAAASEHGAQSDVLREKAPQSSEPSTPTNGQEVPNEHSDGGLGEPDSRESSAPTAPGAAKSESPTVSPPTRVDAQAVTIACSPGNVYSVNRTGQLQLVDSSGSVTNVGTSASSVGSFNGLGIGSGGDAIYAYERTNSSQTATIYQFDPSAEKWTSTGTSYNTSLSSNGSFNGSLIAGAVDLSSSAGNYYFGGFNSGGTQFKLWRYDPTTKSVTYLGYVNTASGGGSSNGDIAFDSQGNLFIARGIGTTTTIFSVTNDAIAAANGGQIAAADSRGVTTVSGVNGLAFDASGKAYLGAGSTVTSYDMPNWTNAKTVTSSLSATTDLASCSSPATITLEKEVMSRVNGGDQFGLSLSSGSNILGTATTSGSANGIQSQRVGPLPVARGTSISFSEAGAGATDLNNYASSYSCAADGNPINIAGDGVSGSLTIPATGNEIICRFINSPLTANVTLNKQTQNQDGGNQQNASGWTVGAKATATAGTVNQAPTAQTQTTGSDGNAKWTLNFNSKTAKADLAVLEQQQPGFEFVSGECKITRLDGTSATVKLNGAAEQKLSTAIQPGDNVECGYVNKKSSADVTVNKDWVIDGKTIANGDQPNGISAELLLDPAGQPAGDPAFGQKWAVSSFVDDLFVDQAAIAA